MSRGLISPDQRSMTQPVPHSEPRRALALDALRGLAILLMVFSGRIPFGVLPDWMYHAQVPPPDHIFNPNLPGITWVDLVFPFFIFTMGAAIPLALSRRLDQGTPLWRIILSVLERGLLLAGFAIYVQHIRPWSMPATADGRATALSLTLCLIGFLLLFPILARMPDRWNVWTRRGIRAAGWIGAFVLMMVWKFKDGSGFSLHKSDIIILVLSNVYFTGAIIWLFTRDKLIVRIGLLGLLAGLILSSTAEGWIKPFWLNSPLPWLFELRFQKYLFLIIPGTVVGDMILNWMKAPRGENRPAGSWTSMHLIATALSMILLNVVLVIGLKARWTLETTIIAVVLCGIAWVLMHSPTTTTEVLMMKMFQWGTFLLFIGLSLEPFEGGIRKDHSTFSYYFVTGGLAMFALIALTIVIDVFQRRRALNLLIESGQNPLIAYAGVNSLVPPALGLLSLDVLIERMTPTPWLGALRGAFMTYLVALAASVCTKKKIFLRA